MASIGMSPNSGDEYAEIDSCPEKRSADAKEINGDDVESNGNGG